ncbi:MAG: aromatic ring-hydroxylating dioxygenase subunit alpha [Chloroflexi bacterium]|nr:aromatic ring-hydroxylating dioxygenase subunit alpha [Chloroflexota bacterium]
MILDFGFWILDFGLRAAALNPKSKIRRGDMAVEQQTLQGRRVGVEEGLRRGLRNFWHPILQSKNLGAGPLGLRRLGEDLVLWRDGQGRPHLFPDRCPHRGARLSLGRIQGDLLACWYHGFEFAGSGECRSVPVEGAESKLITRLTLPSYPVEEHWGLIWAYIGEVDLFPPPPLRLPEELVDPAWSGFICEAHWPANWTLVFDNLADPMHGPFLHSRSYTLGKGLKFDRLHVRELEDGFIVERELQRGVNFDWSEVHLGGLAWFRIDIPYPWFAGPGGPLRILGFATPLDAEHSLIYFLRLRRSSGWRRALWRFLYRTFWEDQHWKVIEQDRVMLESQRGLDSRLFEHHAQSDVGVIHLRGLLNREYARQQERYRQAATRGPVRHPSEAEAEERPV